MEEIVYNISKLYKEGVYIQYSDDNNKDIFIRIRVDPNCNELKKYIDINNLPEISILKNIEINICLGLVSPTI